MFSPADIICLLDDEPSVLKAIGRLLASEGLYAEKFSSPSAFLDHMREYPARLAVIDIRMPEMTGLEVLTKLRVISPDTKVIVITGEGDAAHRTAALKGGASAFFTKPFHDERFLQAVHEAMASSV